MSTTNSKPSGNLNSEKENKVSADDSQGNKKKSDDSNDNKKMLANVEKNKEVGNELSGGSVEEKVDKKGKQNIMNKVSDRANHSHVSKDENEGDILTSQKARDKPFLQSMEIAERGYITRLRPESVADQPTLSQYQIRPGLEDKFKALTVKEMIHTVLNDELGGKVYSEEEAKIWTQAIAGTIRLKVKEMGFPRYKFVVQCVLGEEHGAGVKIGSRCLWDADTDNYASDTFLNETIFCMTAVYAIYFY